ncbi:MAG: hypothetical protein QOJ07_1409 [Thermoleophilaceae bacterium]|nr:hypothetical protein [Thermoleophilaceae bacterium]
MALTRCEWCEHQVPDSNFCVRCGHELHTSTEARGMSGTMSRPGAFSGIARTMSGVLRIPERPASLSGVRRAFAASPNESVLRPSIVSTIFPQLPQPSMIAFRVSLAIGLATVLLLGVLKLYPVGLIAAAVMLPALAALYFYDVSVYEDQPATVIGATMLWGAATGALTAVLAKAISPTGADVFSQSSGSQLLLRGVLIPLIALVLILAGPLYLMRFPRFNDVLDGATFGAGSAIAFAGAEVIVQAISAFGQGLRPPGDLGPWLAKLMTIAIALPILTMAVMGAAAGALWLRFRAPVRDRSALGRLGRPPVALTLAALAVVAGSVVQLKLAIGTALVVIAVLAALALMWLRQVVHVGLLEEALEVEDAPAIVCANCGHQTRMGGFCEYCGISQAALPRGRSGGHSIVTPTPPADA